MLLNKQRGVSLVELMVSITIGMILMAGVLSIFLSSKVTYFANEKLARLQENGRVALNIISHDVREAGYMGCALGSQWRLNVNNASSPLWNYAIPLMAFESDGAGGYTPATNPALVPAATNNSDIIIARTIRRDSPQLRVAADMANTTSDIQVLHSIPIPVALGQIMVVSTCRASSVFQVTGYGVGSPNGTIQHAAAGSNPGNSTNDLEFKFPAGARVAALQTLIYYVGNDASGEPGLYRQFGSTSPSERLIDGVEALQISYGIDTTGDRLTDRYVSATDVTNWDDVMLVNYAVLVRSDEQGTEVDNKTYQLLEAAVGGRTLGPFNDRRSRMVFTTSITLRNRAW
jgi:type IV pilus assembly protein PilW